jgi:hypothetical protein
MASIVLTTLGSALGGALGGPVGAFIGGRIGQAAGSFTDSRIFGGGGSRHSEGPRLSDLSVQTSTYGKMIPITYGTVRIAGNMIWSRPIKETETTTSSSAGGKGGGGGKATQTTTTYSYSVSLAIAICEGPINEILRVWADAKQLDLSQGTYRIYKGTETQTPDSYIESFEGVGNTPAYRGLAYVVIEDFPLADYGNRIPNFTFEVKKKALLPDYQGESVENMIKSVIMIPGSGEFVYDTLSQYKMGGQDIGGNWVQQGVQQTINTHTPYSKSNALVALDQLKETLPNTEWVGVVVTWFGDDLDAGICTIKPGVEYQTGATTAPSTWAVNTFTRSTARQITLVNGYPRYGGTPDDQSLVRYVTELKNRGYNVMLYPMFFMDVTGKPWRGKVTGNATDVSNFFTETNGYNAFITHYANLMVGKVDAFVIGSELIGLTKVTSSAGVYPAVNQLVSLAATVKGILGSGVKITYAADWSEYHHTDGGWFNLDPLWASPNIDLVGIDAYFPLTDAPQNGYDLTAPINGWTSGEGYDWYYSDVARTTQASLSAPYAWKNIDWWWNNTHTNPNSTTTAWTPQMKKIWFTEYGFPSTDGATNQPNVFYDPGSVDGAFPRFSRGRVDYRAQRQGIAATEAKWKNSTMIERRFIWTWDARPYPYWPDLTSVWTDGAQWIYGHWIQGKLGLSTLGAIVADLCYRAGLSTGWIDVAKLTQPVEGYVVSDVQSARESIEQLQSAFFFDAVESGNLLKFMTRGTLSALTIAEDNLVPDASQEGRKLISVTRAQELELPQRVYVSYFNRIQNYQTGTQQSQRMITDSKDTFGVHLPVVLSDQQARMIADQHMLNQWMERQRFTFDLPTRYIHLEPTDVIQLSENGITYTVRILSTQLTAAGIMRVKAVAEDTSIYDVYAKPNTGTSLLTNTQAVTATQMQLLDVPAMPNDPNDKAMVRVAASGKTDGWRGTIIYRSDDGGSNYARWLDSTLVATIGNAVTVLSNGPTTVFDEIGNVTIVIAGMETLSNATELAVLNGSNLALLGDEMIQFKTATLIEPGKYQLSGLLRGRLGTEFATATHVAGERFVLMDQSLVKDTFVPSMIGLSRTYKPVTIGATLGSTTAQNFTYSAKSLKPYSPVTITGIRDGSNNLTINWIRRSRLGGAWLDGADVPLNEENERYEIDIIKLGTPVRTLTSATPTVAYSAANQTTDFGSVQASVLVNIYQMSAIVGRGYAGIATI